MSSLRYSSTPSTAQPIPTVTRSAIPSPPAKKQKMSLSQTYMLATVARRQLQKEAARADHDLRRLVGHANLLDGLMLDLAHAEEEQESWFNESVSSANAAASPEPRHVSWADSHAIPEEAIDEEDEVYDEDSDDEDVEIDIPAPKTSTATIEDDAEDMELDDEYDDSLVLTRSPSHSTRSSSSSSLASSAPSSPPELMHEDSSETEDSESEDESLPPSPTAVQSFAPALDAFSQKHSQVVTTSIFDDNGPLPIAAY